MADTTISFKVEEEMREKAQNLIRESGLTAKDWFNKAVAIAELQNIKEGATDYASDLSELEVHTTRIFELVSNMVQRSVVLRESAVRELETKLEQQREITANFQGKVKDAKDERDQAVADLELSAKEQADLVKQIEELRSTLETNKLLVNEYKEKNDTLNGLVTKFEGYAIENEELKKTLASERHSHQAKIDELTQQNNEQSSTIKDLEQQKNRIVEAHDVALQRLQERLEVEHTKSLLEAERSHQKALTDANNAYTEKLKGLYDDMDKQRHAYEQKIEELQRQVNAERTKNNKSK